MFPLGILAKSGVMLTNEGKSRDRQMSHPSLNSTHVVNPFYPPNESSAKNMPFDLDTYKSRL